VNTRVAKGRSATPPLLSDCLVHFQPHARGGEEKKKKKGRREETREIRRTSCSHSCGRPATEKRGEKVRLGFIRKHIRVVTDRQISCIQIMRRRGRIVPHLTITVEKKGGGGFRLRHAPLPPRLSGGRGEGEGPHWFVFLPGEGKRGVTSNLLTC